jgi:hypothetical protein
MHKAGSAWWGSPPVMGLPGVLPKASLHSMLWALAAVTAAWHVT